MYIYTRLSKTSVLTTEAVAAAAAAAEPTKMTSFNLESLSAFVLFDLQHGCWTNEH
jgi:hypothetical protein